MSIPDEDLLDDNFQLLLEESFTLASSDIPASRPSELIATTPQEPLAVPDLIPPSELQFHAALARFYDVYKPDNVPKVSQIAAKFEHDRLRLWEQLCIKYRLSYRAACKLFTELSSHEMVSAIFGARAASEWPGLLGLSAEDFAKKREFYFSMREELKSREPEESIERDVNRTHQEIAFFHEQETKQAMINMLQLVTVLNGMTYVQGMHEIAGIIYFVVRDEASSFWLLNEVLGDLKDLYNSEVDDDENLGIYAFINNIIKIVKNDGNRKLVTHLENIGYPLSTVILRYTTTLLATELTIPDTTRIWDFVLRAIQTHTMREMTTALATAYLLLMADTLMEASPDLEGVMPAAANFGRSVSFNPDLLVRNVAACYAFEVKIRGKYALPQSPGVIAVFGDAVEGVLNRVGEILEKLNEEPTLPPQ